jgi:hypothetical protein
MDLWSVAVNHEALDEVARKMLLNKTPNIQHSAPNIEYLLLERWKLNVER